MPDNRLSPKLTRVSTLLAAAGEIMGMDQQWHVEPLAKKIDAQRGDIGFELAGIISAMTYPRSELWIYENGGDDINSC